jgi:hypothetical protein
MGSCEAMSVLSMDISSHGDKVKLVWRLDDSILSPYFVNRDALTTAAERVREVLCRVSKNYMRDPSPDYFPFLPELLSAGDDLNAVLFAVTEGAVIGLPSKSSHIWPHYQASICFKIHTVGQN